MVIFKKNLLVMIKQRFIVMIMNKIKDAMRYPFLDRKNYLILGIIILISNLLPDIIYSEKILSIVLILFLGLILFFIKFLPFGFFFRIV